MFVLLSKAFPFSGLTIIPKHKRWRERKGIFSNLFLSLSFFSLFLFTLCEFYFCLFLPLLLSLLFSSLLLYLFIPFSFSLSLFSLLYLFGSLSSPFLCLSHSSISSLSLSLSLNLTLHRRLSNQYFDV